MRKQDITVFKARCKKLDADYKEFDYQTFSLVECTEQLYKKYGVMTPQMERAQFLRWKALAEEFAETASRDNIQLPEAQLGFNPPNCLMLSFRQRDFRFARDLIFRQYKGNVMDKSLRSLRIAREENIPFRIISVFGTKETTNAILEDLRKHQIRPRILRDSYFRRDFLHYFDGKLLVMSKREFKAFIKGQDDTIAQQMMRTKLK